VMSRRSTPCEGGQSPALLSALATPGWRHLFKGWLNKQEAGIVRHSRRRRRTGSGAARVSLFSACVGDVVSVDGRVWHGYTDAPLRLCFQYSASSRKRRNDMGPAAGSQQNLVLRNV